MYKIYVVKQNRNVTQTVTGKGGKIMSRYIYLDNAATTQVKEEVLQEMQ